jgi:hypothetical protein
MYGALLLRFCSSHPSPQLKAMRAKEIDAMYADIAAGRYPLRIGRHATQGAYRTDELQVSACRL